ncbi:MAG: Gfo/Idh/MocA family protein [Oscillospiraceae bacterium]|jgi:xylose dehydrogenase (NAD/NADP)
MKQVRWGILGCADIAERRVFPAFQEVRNGVVAAMATRGNSPRLERIRAAYPPFEVCSYEELLAQPTIDAVYIPLPNSMHLEWTLKAAKAGKHVLCEKPMVCRSSELALIKQAAKEYGVYIMEAFACLHSPLYATIRKLIAAGEIGELRVVETVFSSPLKDPDSPKLSPQFLGGSIHDVGCYNLLSIRQVTGREPRSVKAFGTFLPSGVDGTVTALLDMGDGIMGYSLSSKDGANHRGLKVIGTRGIITFPKTPNTWGHLEITLAQPEGNRIIPLTVPNNYATQLEQMGRCILEGEAPLVSLEESEKNIRAMEMVHAAIGSWMSRQ